MADVDVSVYEGVSIAEDVEVIYPWFSISVFDSIGIEDGIEMNLSGHSHEVNTYEEVGVNDQFLIDQIAFDPLHLFASVYDGVGVAETVKGSWELNGSVYDSVTLQEVVSGYLGFEVSVSDSISVIESIVSVAQGLGVSVYDAVGVIDFGKLLSFAKGYMTIVASAFLPSITAVGVKPSIDAVGKKATIVIGKSKPPIIRANVFDGIGVGDSPLGVTSAVILSASQNVSVGESVEGDVVFPISVHDEVDVWELVVGGNNRAVYVFDEVSVDENKSAAELPSCIIADGSYSIVYSAVGEVSYGGTDYTDTGNGFQSTFRDSFSIVADIKPDYGANTYRNCICGVSNDNPFYISRVSVRYESNKFTIYYNVQNDDHQDYVQITSISAHDIEDGEYHEIAVVVDNVNEEIRAYLDGVECIESSVEDRRYFAYTGVDMLNFDETHNLYIGSENNKGSRNYGFYGYIKNFYLYSGIRYTGL